jgi:hypothetical protein
MSYASNRKPLADRICDIKFEGALFDVSFDGEAEDSDERGTIPASVWVDMVKIGGVWFEACEIFTEDFHTALSVQLCKEFAEAGSL